MTGYNTHRGMCGTRHKSKCIMCVLLDTGPFLEGEEKQGGQEGGGGHQRVETED